MGLRGPKSRNGGKQCKMIGFRATDAEQEAIRAVAANKGISVSQYMRDKILKGVKVE